MECLFHAAVLAVPAADTTRHPEPERREREVPAGHQDVAKAAGDGDTGHRADDCQEHSLIRFAMSGFRHLAPAGAPIRFSDLMASAQLCLSTADVPAIAEGALRAQAGGSQLRFVSTGRA